MDIYNLDSDTINKGINNKDKKIIKHFLNLPNIIKKRCFYQNINFDSLIEQIKISDYDNVISLFQDDIIMFEKLYNKILETLKDTSIQKYRFNKFKIHINNISNYLISHLMTIIEKNNIYKFRKIITKHKDFFYSWNIKAKKIKHSRNKKINIIKEIISIYDKEFQKLAIYIASKGKANFINVIIDNKIININYKLISNIIQKYPDIFIKIYTSNSEIQKFIKKHIKKFLYVLNLKKITSISKNYMNINSNFIYTLCKEIIKKNISKQTDLNLIEVQKNIAPENKTHFLNIVKMITLDISNKYLCDYLEDKRNNLNNKDLISLLNFSDDNNINLNHNLIFLNLLSKGKISILKHFTENYQIKKIPFDFLHHKILLYDKYSWSQKYNMKYCIHFLLDNNLLDKPDHSQCQNILDFLTSDKIKNNTEYNFTPYWEKHVFQKLWIFFMNTSFIDVILNNILKNIEEEMLIEKKECPICYCEITNKDNKLECNHCFHKECISEYYKNKNYNAFNNIENQDETIILDCPYCRKIVLEI